MNGIHLQCRLRLLFILLVITCTSIFSLTANAGSQGDATITLSASDITLAAVFKAIYQQTKIPVIYNNDQLNDKERVSVSFHKTRVDDVLRSLLEKRGYMWIYNATYISIRLRPKQEGGLQGKNAGPGMDTSANARSINGKVTDAAGVPLIGATVKVKGEPQGTVTDVNGDFTLAKVAHSDVLLVSSVGYESREIPVQGKSILARLNVVVNELDETVVVAYGNTTKRFNTGNVTTIKGEDIAKQPVNNPLHALEGRVPGLFVRQSSGFSGGGVTALVQGQNSIGKGNDPFYVIDGVPYTAQLLSSWGNFLGTSGVNITSNGNPLSFINPSDIESISILKDADATAIYGSRAANGAILITTKKGAAGETSVNIDLQQGWGKVSRKMDLLNREQYLQMRHEAKGNDNEPLNESDVDINGHWDTTRSTDWQKELIGRTAQYTNLNATVSGGSVNMQYLIGATYHRETTVFPGDFADQKGAVHFSINSKPSNRKFHVQLSGNYLIDDNRLYSEDLTRFALQTAPVAPPLYNPDGSLNWMPNASGASTFRNPLAYLYNKYRNKTTNLVASTVLGYQLTPELEISSNFGYTNLQSDETGINPLVSYAPEERPYASRAGLYGRSNINSWMIEPQLTYKGTIGKGKLEALLGTSIQQSNSNGDQTYGMGYSTDAAIGDIFSAANLYPVSSTQIVYKYNALFGRLNYNWQHKYILNLTGRRDGSSRFGAENRFHNFGAIGAAWIFTEEHFLEHILPVISFGKLRASIGTTGNDQIGEYQYLDRFVRTPVDLPYQGSTGLGPVGIPNSYLQWEETRKTNLGVELGFLQEKILLNVNYYNNRSSNQLLLRSLASMAGFATITENFSATVRNFGWEFSLSSNNIKSPAFNWTTNINLTIARNKLVKYDNLEKSADATRLVIGQPVTVRKFYHLLGVNRETGVYEFADKDGKPTTQPDYNTDRTVLVNTSPDFYGGFSNTFSYKGIQLDILFQFVKQKGPNYLFGIYPGVALYNQPATVLDRWQKPGDVTAVQRYNSNFSLGESYRNATYSSDAGFDDASFIRLKNISLSWQLPEGLIKAAHLRNARIYVQGQNLLTITNYKGLDPETLSSYTLPPLRVLTVGLTVGL